VHDRTEKASRAAGIVAAGLLVVVGLYYTALENTYVTWHRQPQPEIGRTIPYSAKGVTVYITKNDQEVNSAVKWTLLGSGLVFVVGLVFSGELRRIMSSARNTRSN
jgi:hypothetical protein